MKRNENEMKNKYFMYRNKFYMYNFFHKIMCVINFINWSVDDDKHKFELVLS